MALQIGGKLFTAGIYFHKEYKRKGKKKDKQE